MLYFFIGHCSDVEKESTASSMPRFICCGLKRKVRTLFSLIMTINCNRASQGRGGRPWSQELVENLEIRLWRREKTENYKIWSLVVVLPSCHLCHCHILLYCIAILLPDLKWSNIRCAHRGKLIPKKMFVNCLSILKVVYWIWFS